MLRDKLGIIIQEFLSCVLDAGLHREQTRHHSRTNPGGRPPQPLDVAGHVWKPHHQSAGIKQRDARVVRAGRETNQKEQNQALPKGRHLTTASWSRDTAGVTSNPDVVNSQRQANLKAQRKISAFFDLGTLKGLTWK